MQYRAFIDQVRTRALLEDTAEAEKVIRATLETLGERIVATEVKALADHLPPEIGAYLHQEEHERQAGEEEKGPMDLDEFYRRVARREGVARKDAVYHARVVASVLSAALPAAAFARLRSLLPDEFDHLFAFVGKGDQDIQSATARDDYW